MSTNSRRLPAVAALVLGGAYFVGAILWGMVGTVFGGLMTEEKELGKIVAFLLIGPFAVLPAGVVMLLKPRVGATCLIVAGTLAGWRSVLAPDWMEPALMLCLVPVPMLILGIWQWRVVEQEPTGGRPERFSFSVRTLLIATTVVAYFLALIAALVWSS